MNVMETVAAVLKMEGVEWVSCFPSNQLIELVAREGIRTIMFRQERGAIMAADGFSRVNDRKKFGVVITQGGPGAENSMGGSLRRTLTTFPSCTFLQAQPWTDTPSDPSSRPFALIRASPNAAKSSLNRIRLPA